MVGDLDSLAITQDLVTDCSFVASLCIGAALERRSGNRIITGNIFPQRNGRPVYNPSGTAPEVLGMIV
jgi:calpain-7